MDLNKCNNCGGEYVSRGGKDVCRSCGACRHGNQAEALKASLSQATQILREGRFEEAENAFGELIKKYPALSEAYWGRVKARYRIRYMQNENGKMVPVCDLYEDPDYQRALQYASAENKDFLKKQAEYLREEGHSKTSGAFCINDNRIRKKSKIPIVLSVFLSLALISAVVVGFLTGVFHKHTPGTEANCTEEQFCTKCNALIAPAKGHQSGDWEIVVPATKNREGLRIRKCTVCGEVSDEEILQRLPSEGLSFISNGDGTYLVSGIGTCRATDIVIPSTYNGGRVTGIGDQAFSGCSSLTSIVIPEGVTSIGSSAFRSCSSLTNIVIPKGVTSIGDSAFRACSGLTNIVIPESVTSIGSSAFWSCSNLTNIVIPEGVKSIGDYAFRSCSSLTNIVIPKGVTSIGSSAFQSCSSLTNIVIPEGVMSIGDSAFRYCTGVTSIVIPKNMRIIGSTAFSGCGSLTSINFGGTLTQWRSISFMSGWNSGTGDYTITCSNGAITKSGVFTPN